MLREQTEQVDVLPVDVDEILTRLPIEVTEIPLDGCLGLYLPPPIGPALMLKVGQQAGQRRFTIAHELGHFSLPKHASSVKGGCVAKDVHAAAVSSSVEREANEFAAELLMPRSHFGAAVRDRDPSFELVRSLAAEERFFVSRTAAAIRTVELSRESCALVCATGGEVTWWVKSPNCDFYLESERGHPLPPSSIARAVVGGESPCDRPEEVDPGTWFNPHGDGTRCMESTFSIPSLDQVLSLIWRVPADWD